jgi:hypothetical protein
MSSKIVVQIQLNHTFCFSVTWLGQEKKEACEEQASFGWLKN